MWTAKKRIKVYILLYPSNKLIASQNLVTLIKS